MTLERALLRVVAPAAGMLLLGGYFVGAENLSATFSNFSRTHIASLEDLPVPDSWQLPGEEVTDLVRAAHVAGGGTITEFKEPEVNTALAVPQEPVEPAAAPVVTQPPAASPKKVTRPAPKPEAKPEAKPERVAAARPDAAQPRSDTAQPRPASAQPRQATVIEPPRISQLPPPPSANTAAPQPIQPPRVTRQEERGILGRSWDTVTRTTSAATDAVVAAPGTVWRATRKTVDVVVDTTVDTAKAIIPGSRRSSND